MAQKFRSLRCPNCKFEHLTLGAEGRDKSGKAVTPWTCLRCHWSGDVLEGRKLTRRPPPDRPEPWEKSSVRNQ